MRGRSTMSDYEKEAQDIINCKSEDAKSPEIQYPWLFTPHSFITISFIVCLGIYGLNMDHNHLSLDANTSGAEYIVNHILRALPFTLLTYFAIGLFIFPSGPFSRPHPIVWRLLFGASLLYLIGCFTCLFLPPDLLRLLLNKWNPIWGIYQPLKLYASPEQCVLNFENVKERLDVFFVAHYFGWLAKALMIRHRLFCWVFSILWEFVEVTMAFGMPNFAECWWDQWIMDVLVCNGIGIETGLFLCNFLEYRRYHWSGGYSVRTIKSKLKYLGLQFTPKSWTCVRWERMESIKRYFCAQILLLAFANFDLSVFILKRNLHLEATSTIILLRIALLCAVGIPSLRQAYLYIADSNVNSIGTQSLVLSTICVCETLLCIKTTDKEYLKWPLPPNEVIMYWVIGFIIYILTTVIVISRFDFDSGVSGKEEGKLQKRRGKSEIK